MKIVYIDKFDHFFSSGNYITTALNTHSIQVIKIPLTIPLTKIQETIVNHKPDFVLCGKGTDYFVSLIPWLKQQNIMIVHWSFDRLFYMDRAETIIRRHKIYLADLVCTTDGGCNQQWKHQFDVNHITLRQGVSSPDHIWVNPIPQDFDIVFIGSIYNNYRRKLTTFLSATYGKRFRIFGGSEQSQDQIRGLDLNVLVRSVKIVVGDSLPGDHYWSNRLYEIRGRGGFLLHPETIGMKQEFNIGKELIVFPRHDMIKLQQIIDYYLEHEDERETIRRNGFDKCPTYDDRISVLLDHIKSIRNTKKL